MVAYLLAALYLFKQRTKVQTTKDTKVNYRCFLSFWRELFSTLGDDGVNLQIQIIFWNYFSSYIFFFFFANNDYKLILQQHDSWYIACGLRKTRQSTLSPWFLK